jgi:hypothetical protein
LGKIINKIGSTDTFKNAIFYRFKGIYKTNNKDSRISIDKDSERYKLRGSNTYKMKLSINSGKQHLQHGDISYITIDSHNLHIDPQRINLGLRVDEKEISLVTTRVVSDIPDNITLKIDNKEIEGPLFDIPIS